jgi:hypothetical protein
MIVTIQFCVDNDAFNDPAEVERVLSIATRKIAHRGYESEFTFPLNDSNGNRIGFCAIAESQPSHT